MKKILKSWGTGVAGMLLISSVFVGIVSIKYGHLIISSKGNITHAVVGPKDTDRRHPFFVGGLYKPRDANAIHVYEDPADVKFKTWSPFESRAYLMHQINLIKENAVYILNHFVNKSPYFNYALIIGILTLIPVALLLNPLNKDKRFLYKWVILTFCIYCSGLLLITAKHPRRFYALMTAYLFLLFHFIEEFKSGIGNLIPDKRKRLMASYLLLIVVSAFALKPCMHLLKSVKNIITVDYVNPYREIAEEISIIDFPAPYAFIRSSQKPHTDIYLAYYLKKQLLGRPLSGDAEGITGELKAAGARSLLVFDNPGITEYLKKDSRYIHMADIKLKDDPRYAYEVNIEQDEIAGWDKEVNIFELK
ncbi:MAG: hypothetical protein HY758_10455 [Nitrospirae bacterium]|nr:hypothetical protein [Nitrospirota bacterium]